MIFALVEHADGIATIRGNHVVYDIARNEAHFGECEVEGHALVWEVAENAVVGALLVAEVTLDPSVVWLMRCDRIDFPPRGIAYTHTHPGPGTRYLLHGSIRIDSGGESHSYGPGGAWFESGPEPVYAAASESEDTAFVRVLLLPQEWEGKRTIRYVDPSHADKPKTQRATIFVECPIDL